MDRRKAGAFASAHPKYGTVYSVADAKEMLDLVRREGGYVYQTHPRTKGSTGFPDKILTADYFRDASYLGVGWKAMPADLSSPRLGDRVLDLVDELNNQGLRKRLLGEVDVFQVDHTHELYAHMNVNYVRLDRLPTFDRWGDALVPLARGEFFTTTGEVLLPDVDLASSSADEIVARTHVLWTFPLRFAEIVWGDGLVVAFECGAIVNPDGLHNQVEGAVIQGLGGALFEAIEFADGALVNGSMAKYRVPRFRDAPRIEIVLLDRKDLPSAGAGETPIVCVAPAIGSAVRAFGRVLNELPVRLA